MIRSLNLEAPQGERHAEFEKVALPHLDAIYRTALWMTRNQQDAEDLVQETYLRAFRSFDTFTRETNCRAWLFKILSNSNINRFRRAALRSENVSFEDVKLFVASPGEAETAPATGDCIEGLGEMLDDEVKGALETLPEYFRLPLLLSSVEDMSYKDISRMLDCPMGTVMSRIYRGRQILKKSLAGYARARGYQEVSA